MNKGRWIVGFVALLGTLAFVAGCFLLNRPPIASFVVNYNTTEDPLVVELDASLSSDPDGDAITTYMWAFVMDDPEGPEVLAPLAFSAVRQTPVLLLRFPVEGTAEIQLVVVDERATSSEVAAAPVVVPSIDVEPMS